MELIYLATFLVVFTAAILSGIAHGGGGYITAPYWLISGMTPAQGATTGDFMGIGMGVSSLIAFRKTDHFPRNKKLTVALTVFTVFSSVIGALILTHVDTGSFKMILAIITLLSIPTLFIDRSKIILSRRYRNLGIGLLLCLLFISSIITSSAFTIFIAVGLSQLFSLSILQSTALRRLIALVQSLVIFPILAFQGNFLPFHALAALLGGSLGSYIGTRIAIKKGEKFAKYALAIGAFIGAIALLI